MKLSINLATRGRPELLISTIERTLSNIVCPDTQLIVSADDDDDGTAEVITARYYDHPQVGLSIEPREDSLGAKYNRVLEVAPADVYLAMVDYAPHVTSGFDQKILDAAAYLPDGIGVVYNHMANLSFPGINAVTALMVEAMGGKMYPEYFPVWFIDHWLDDIARYIGRISFADVEIDTLRRPGTQNMRDLEFWTRFFTMTAPMREDIAKSIIRSPIFEAPTLERLLLERNFPLTRERSRIINAMVLAGGTGGPEVPDYDRHRRLRDRASVLVKDLGGSIEEEWEIPGRPIGPRINPTSVLFATPSANWAVAKEFYQSSLLTVIELARRSIPFNFLEVSGDIYVDRARCRLLTQFLDEYPNVDNLFFIDDDVGWPADKVIEFLERPELIISGIYQMKKRGKAEFPVNLVRDVEGNLVERDGLLLADLVPTGFLRLKRAAIERLRSVFQDTYIDDAPGGGLREYYALFEHGVTGEDRRFRGEDVIFSKRCVAAGIEMWVDPDIRMTHRGSHVWDEKLLDHLSSVKES